MKICVCTMFSPAYQELADLTVPNLIKYASRHGYYTHLIYVEDEKWMYKKHEAFKELFEQGFDLIWYKDVDAIITNLSIPIESFIDGLHSFFLTEDFTELNGGSVLIRNTNAGKTINDIVLEKKGQYENEQNYFNTKNFKALTDWVMILQHPSINSYRYDLYPECTSHVGREDLGDWMEGHFVLHVPALSIPKRLEILSQVKIIE